MKSNPTVTTADARALAMTAYRVHEFGGPEVIQEEVLPLESPGSGQMRVRIHAVGVGPWDVWIS